VTTDVSRPAPDATVARFIRAPALSLLSPESRGRISIARLRARYSGLARAKVVLSQRITNEFGVVAVQNGVRAAAFAMRLVGERWLIELGGPLLVDPIGPDPGAREEVVAQIAAAVTGQGGAATAVMWIDGQALNPQIRGTATNVTMFANLDPPLDRGRHVAVVFAAGMHEASATAWTFTVAG
jgi:hypothetical protein